MGKLDGANGGGGGPCSGLRATFTAYLVITSMLFLTNVRILQQLSFWYAKWTRALVNYGGGGDFNTCKYTAPTIFNCICRRMDTRGIGKAFAPQRWERLEAAFNKTMVEYFTPFDQQDLDDGDEFRLVYNLDDDKGHYNRIPGRKVSFGMESRLRRIHHVRDNRLGFNNHSVLYAAPDISTILKIEHEHHVADFGIFEDIVRTLFNSKA